MNLRFFSGSVTPSSPPRKSRARVDVDQRDVVAVAEQRDDLLRLALAHQAVVDEHAGQLVADRFVDQHRRDRAVDAARQAADHAALADLLADVGDLGVAEAGHRPVAGAAADVPHEIGEQLAAVGRVHDLRVEHQAVALRLLVGGDREGRAFGRGRRPRSPARASRRGRRGSSTPGASRRRSRGRRTRRDGATMSMNARPNSRWSEATTLPPSCWCSVCWP